VSPKVLQFALVGGGSGKKGCKRLGAGADFSSSKQNISRGTARFMDSPESGQISLRAEIESQTGALRPCLRNRCAYAPRRTALHKANERILNKKSSLN
jgi:hypothetical protein